MKEEIRLQKQTQFIEQAQLMDCHKDCDYSSVYFIRKDKGVKIFCKKCNHYFSQTPKKHLGGQSCPICGKEKARLYHKGNYEHFIEESKQRFGDVFYFPNIKEEFESTKSIVTIYCKKCGNTFTKRACDHITSKNGGCKQCRLRNNKQLISFNELCIKFPNVCFTRFDGYKDIRNDNVSFVCDKHGEQLVSLKRIIEENECVCKFCKLLGKKQFTYNDIKDVFEQAIGDKLSFDKSEFVKIDEEMHFKCNSCGYKFKRLPFMFLKNKLRYLCPNCGRRETSLKRMKTTEQFIKDAIRTYGKDDYDFTETTYNGSDKDVTIKCNECGRYFTIEANSFLQGHGCPYHNCNSSIKEKEVVEFIKSLDVDNIHTNDRTLLNGEEIDIYLPDYKVAFEFDGIFWHTTQYKIDKRYHMNKTDKCLSKGVKLFHIFEDEWNNKKDIWKSIIKESLNKQTITVNGFDCDVRCIDKETAEEFLTKNCLNYCDGLTNIYYGLFYNSELVMLMYFYKTTYGYGKYMKYDYVIRGFVSKIDVTVQGGEEKLLNKLCEENKNKVKLFFKTDRRYYLCGYEKFGFRFLRVTKPLYSYVINGKRYKFTDYETRKMLREVYGYDGTITKREFCKRRGWFPIYDCGQSEYEIIFG